MTGSEAWFEVRGASTTSTRSRICGACSDEAH
jgi:hypothetical protein